MAKTRQDGAFKDLGLGDKPAAAGATATAVLENPALPPEARNTVMGAKLAQEQARSDGLSAEAGPEADWEVTLDCPTPLRFPKLVVKATSQVEAWHKFMKENGITDSKHPKTVRKVA